MSSPTRSPLVVIVGAGPAGLMAAETAAAAGASVLVIEAARMPGRKFLLAGRSGLNLSNSTALLDGYGSDAPFLSPMLAAFDGPALCTWCASLGEPVVVGSSGRLFPTSWRAAPLLRSWLRRLGELGVEVRTSTKWLGLDDHGRVVVETDAGTATEEPIAVSAVVLACGGASWPRTGSDGGWVPVLRDLGVSVDDLRPANAGLLVDWSDVVRRHVGEVLKDVVVHAHHADHARHADHADHVVGDHPGRRVRGDLVIVESGLQGTPAYTLASAIGGSDAPATITIDLRPDLPLDELARRFAGRTRGESNAHLLRRHGISTAAVAVANESSRLPSEAYAMAARLKSLPLTVIGPEPLARAISTAGGVAWSSLDDRLALVAHPHVFVAGEMIGWDAPTGGYLLHACLATGAWAGQHAALASLPNDSVSS